MSVLVIDFHYECGLFCVYAFDGLVPQLSIAGWKCHGKDISYRLWFTFHVGRQMINLFLFRV